MKQAQDKRANDILNRIDHDMDKLWIDNSWTNDTMSQTLIANNRKQILKGAFQIVASSLPRAAPSQ
jgi:hypothetical protein